MQLSARQHKIHKAKNAKVIETSLISTFYLLFERDLHIREAGQTVSQLRRTIIKKSNREESIFSKLVPEVHWGLYPISNTVIYSMREYERGHPPYAQMSGLLRSLVVEILKNLHENGC